MRQSVGTWVLRDIVYTVVFMDLYSRTTSILYIVWNGSKCIGLGTSCISRSRFSWRLGGVQKKHSDVVLHRQVLQWSHSSQFSLSSLSLTVFLYSFFPLFFSFYLSLSSSLFSSPSLSSPFYLFIYFISSFHSLYPQLVSLPGFMFLFTRVRMPTFQFFLRQCVF